MPKDRLQEKLIRKLEDQSKRSNTQLIKVLERENSKDEIIREFF